MEVVCESLFQDVEGRIAVVVFLSQSSWVFPDVLHPGTDQIQDLSGFKYQSRSVVLGCSISLGLDFLW